MSQLHRGNIPGQAGERVSDPPNLRPVHCGAPTTRGQEGYLRTGTMSSSTLGLQCGAQRRAPRRRQWGSQDEQVHEILPAVLAEPNCRHWHQQLEPRAPCRIFLWWHLLKTCIISSSTFLAVSCSLCARNPLTDLWLRASQPLSCEDFLVAWESFVRIHLHSHPPPKRRRRTSEMIVTPRNRCLLSLFLILFLWVINCVLKIMWLASFIKFWLKYYLQLRVQSTKCMS